VAREGKHRKPIHLAAHFPGVNSTTVWTDPQSGSQIEFDSFAHMARTAETRLFFDFLFLAEGLATCVSIAGPDLRPSTWWAGRTRFTVAGGAGPPSTEPAGVDRGRSTPTFNEPFEVARAIRERSTSCLTAARGLEHRHVIGRVHRCETSGAVVSSSSIMLTATSGPRSFSQRGHENFWDSWAIGCRAGRCRCRELISIPNRVAVVDHHGPQFDVRGSCDAARWAAWASDSVASRGTPTKAATSVPTTPTRLFTLHGSLEDGPALFRRRRPKVAPHPTGRKSRGAQGVFPAATFRAR